MLDEQPAAVVEAILERGMQLQQSDSAPKYRYELQASVIKYLEQHLHEARARQHRLAQAITGAEDLPND